MKKKEQHTKIPDLRSYSLDKLKQIDDSEFDLIKSDIVRIETHYFIFGQVGRETVPYTEEGIIYHEHQVEVPIKNWIRTSKERYNDLYVEDANKNSFSPNRVKKEQIKVKNPLFHDLAYIQDQMKSEPKTKWYNEYIQVCEKIADVAHLYSNELFALHDEYALGFIEEKAVYFDEICTKYTNLFQSAITKRDEFIKSNKRAIMENDIAKIESRISELEIERNRLKDCLDQQN